MELAEQRRARYVVLADRVARLYAPAVHGLALATFLGWLLIMGAPWQLALLYAVAVLIITCPCALGLAVPAVQVIGSGRLLRRGILLKSATALERLAEVDTVVFDKTGTLTLGRPTVDRSEPIDEAALRLGAALAAASRHPLARALAAAAPDVLAADGVVEVPGAGLRWSHPGGRGPARQPRLLRHRPCRTTRRAPSCGSRAPGARRCASASGTKCAPTPPPSSPASGRAGSPSSCCRAIAPRSSGRSPLPSASRAGGRAARPSTRPPIWKRWPLPDGAC